REPVHHEDLHARAGGVLREDAVEAALDVRALVPHRDDEGHVARWRLGGDARDAAHARDPATRSRNPPTAATCTSLVKRRAVSRPRAARAAARAGSAPRRARAAASAAGSPGGTSRPLTPSSTRRGTPPTAVATIGAPRAIASRRT